MTDTSSKDITENSELSYTGENGLNITILEDHKAIAKQAADRIAVAIGNHREDRPFVLGLATGVTMEPVYEELIRMHNEDGLSFANVKFFNLDAYAGLQPDDRNAYGHQLKELFLNHVDAQPENMSFVQGVDFDPEAYEDEIREAGGIDIQLLGLGGEGHIGFNEVGSAFDSKTRKIELSSRTRTDNAHFFDREGEVVPTHAYTMGVGTILQAKEIITLASGNSKAWAIRNMMDPTGLQDEELSDLELSKEMAWQAKNLADADRDVPDAYIDEAAIEASKTKEATDKYRESQQKQKERDEEYIQSGKVVEDLPARALHAHPKVTMLVDQQAASMVRVSDLIQHSNYDDEQIKAHIEKFSAKEIEVVIKGQPQTIWVSPDFDFYDPETMELDEEFRADNQKHVDALSRVLSEITDTYVGAHQDDAEIEAGPIILEALRNPDKKMLSIIMTDGAASKSKLNHEDGSEKLDLSTIPHKRLMEQREAALKSKTPVIQLGYPSAAINQLMGTGKKNEAAHVLGSLFEAMPEMKRAFGHNPLDKHDTHLGSFACWVSALRVGAPNLEKAVGLEGWGGLCGLNHSDLERFIVDSPEDLQQITDWISVYKSQISLQGRAYDGATKGRMEEHAAYVTSPHGSNPPAGMVIGVDVTQEVKTPSMPMAKIVEGIMDKAKEAKMKKASQHPILEQPDLRASPWAKRTTTAAEAGASSGITGGGRR